MKYIYRWLGEDGAMSIQEGGRRRCPAGKWRWWKNMKRRGKSHRRTHSWTWYLLFSLSLSTFLDTGWLFVHFHFLVLSFFTVSFLDMVHPRVLNTLFLFCFQYLFISNLLYHHLPRFENTAQSQPCMVWNMSPREEDTLLKESSGR